MRRLDSRASPARKISAVASRYHHTPWRRSRARGEASSSPFPALAPSAPGVTRAIGRLRAARSALDDDLPDRHVGALLDHAEAELDAVGRALEFPGYRPDEYLRGRLV